MANPKIEVEIGAITDKLKKGVDGSILSLSQLEKRAKQLQSNLENATDIKSIANYNRRLVETKAAISQLKTVGLESSLTKIGSSAGFASQGVSKLGSATSQYNSIGIEFARIIQDAPFGIIGVGNNITQLAGSFSNLQKQTGSASKALGIALQSIVSPANLVVLGVSAVTTALTLYAQSARSTAPEVQTLKEKQDDYNESLRETDQILKQGFFNQLLKDVGLIQTIEVGGRLIDVQAFEKADEVLQKLGGTIDGLNKNQLQALQSFLGEKIADATRNATNATTDLEKSLALQDFDVYQKLLSEVNSQLKFYKTDTEKATKATKDLQAEIFSFSTNPFADAYFEAIRQGAEFRKRIEDASSGLIQQDPVLQAQSAIANSLSGFDPTEKTTLFKGELESLLEKVDELSGAFSGLGSLIGKAFNNAPLGQFVGEFLRFSAKLIAANFKIASANAITGATQSATATGPAAAITLPAFIAGAVGLVASAFAAIGGGGARSVGSSGVGGGVAQTFGGSGSTGLSFDRSLSLTGEFRVKGQDLVYVFNEASSRNAKG